MTQTKQALRSKVNFKDNLKRRVNIQTTKRKHIPSLNSEFSMNWQYFLSDRSSQLSTALMKTQRGDQWRVLERVWTHNGTIKSKGFLNMGLRGIKRITSTAVYLPVKVLVLLCYWEQRTRAATWLVIFITVLSPSVAETSFSTETNKQKKARLSLAYSYLGRGNRIMVIFSLLVCSSLLQNGGTCLSAVELGCTVHCMGCLSSQTGSSALPYSERVPVILFWYVPGQDLSLCDLSGVNYSWELLKGKLV